MFNARFFRKGALNLSGASSDCLINKSTAEKLSKLKVSGDSVSLKGSSTAQFHLGVIPELSDKESYKGSLVQAIVRGRTATCGTHSVPWEEQLRILRSVKFWKRYLGKGDYYVQLGEDGKTYSFFSMRDVIDFIVRATKWRLLETGRIKGDLPDPTAKNPHRYSQVLTFEYRPEHGSFVLGAHGGRNGFKFARILESSIPVVRLK